MTTALSYIQSKGFEYQIQSGQIVLKVCPFCGDLKSHFYIDQTEGVFFCHKCQERGNLIILKKHYGDYQERNTMNRPFTKPQGGIKQAFEEKATSYHTPHDKEAIVAHEQLLSNQDGLKFIMETRGISIETVKAFKIGLQVEKGGGRWLTIPHYEKGKLVNIKSRSLPPANKTFRRIKDCRSILFNSDIIETSKDKIFITEGELDALTLIDQGIKNAIGTTVGAGAFLPEWIDLLQNVKKIILCYDPDETGQKGARETARRLGYDRCFNVVLPDGQDVNEYFRAGHDVFEFQTLVNEARAFDIQGITSFQDCLDRLQAERSGPEPTTGLMTGIHSLDRINKRGMKDGELIIYASPPGVGKTSLVLQVISNHAFQEIPALFFSMEMGINDLTEKICQSHTRTENIGFSEIQNTRKDYTGKPLYLGRCYTKPSLDGIMNILRAAIKRYGLKLLAFDHLHFLIRSLANQTQEISLAVQGFKLLAEEMQIPVILIAQPRKTDLDKPMTASDLKDSSSIHSDADYIIIMHRNRLASGKVESGMETKDQSLDPVTLVRFEKARYGRGGECLLYFHGEYSRFDEMDLTTRGTDDGTRLRQQKDLYC
jgi:KaiC/GvpD/RAD55 family RecA-like ATPase